MIATIIDGKKISKKIKNKLINELNFFLLKGYRKPGLAFIVIGDNIASKIYVSNKINICKEISFNSFYFKFKSDIKEILVIKLIKKLNYDNKIDGILIQLPLPTNFSNRIFEYINPNKDVDGLNPINSGKLLQGYPKFRSCTAKGIITLLDYYNINITGINAVIVNSSNIVGKPMIFELLSKKCTVTIAHKFTKNLYFHTKNSDLVIIAIGKPNFISDKYIKKKAIVIDVGINLLKNGKIIGDIEYEKVIKKASYITPVPGGVGPMTIISLMQNTFESYKNFINYNNK